MPSLYRSGRRPGLLRPLITGSVLTCALLSNASAEDQNSAKGERVLTNTDGHIVTIPLPVPETALNPWPAKWEATFIKRRDAFIRQYAGKGGPGSTALENEKQTYPPNILAFCAGNEEAALDGLQAQDAMAGNHAHTAGIDYYWSFTLKGQMRKYFFLGQYLQPKYKQQMFDGAKAWVAKDPRPNTELVSLLKSKDEQVVAYATEILPKLWRNKDQLLAMADKAEAEGHNNKIVFAKFIRNFAETVGEAPPTDTEGWTAWYAALCKGGWQIYEEYDRRTNLRPHPANGIGKGPVGTDWSSGTRGGVVDWRNTDNLRGMREVAVYLMAEETGSELVRRIFKERIRMTAKNFITIGNGEWDSPAYLSHTASAYVNLYDFAKDEEVRMLAKTIMDFVVTSAAVKYRKGSFGGPNCRDYGTITAHSGPSGMIHFWAGPESETTFKENDIAHYATSAYRPPAAVVALARKDFELPVELFATHPTYSNFLPGADAKPAYHETMWIDTTYQMGSLIEGGGYDVNGCKILVDNVDGGADFVVPSSQGPANCINRSRSDRFAQHRNLLIMMNRSTKKPAKWSILLPSTATITQESDITFVTVHHTWMAIRSRNVSFAATLKSGKGRKGRGAFSYLPGQTDTIGATAIALELGNPRSHDSFAAFKQAVLDKGHLDDAAWADGRLTLLGSEGHSVGLSWKDKTVEVQRDGKVHDPKTAHRFMWQNSAGGKAPVSLGWKAGVLQVEAGGHSFTGTFDLETQTYSSTQSLAD